MVAKNFINEIRRTLRNKRKKVLVTLILVLFALVFFFYNSLYLKKIGYMAGARDDYAYINENTFRNGGQVEYCVFQEEKKPVGRISNHPAYTLGEEGESTVYIVRDPEARGKPYYYYNTSKFPNGLSRDGKITGFIVEEYYGYEGNKYFTDERVVAYLNEIYEQEPGFSQKEKQQWEEDGAALLIGFHLCLENAPISFSRGKAAGVKKTNKGMVVYTSLLKRDDNGEEEFQEWGKIADKTDEEIFEPYFEVYEEYRQRKER